MKKLGMISLIVAATAFAHHQFSTEFDAKKPMSLTGKVAKVEWREPHVQIFLDVKNEAGKTQQWQLEAARPDYLSQHGLKAASFSKGATIKVDGYQALTNPHLLSARMLTVDGKEMEVADAHEDGGPAK